MCSTSLFHNTHRFFSSFLRINPEFNLVRVCVCGWLKAIKRHRLSQPFWLCGSVFSFFVDSVVYVCVRVSVCVCVPRPEPDHPGNPYVRSTHGESIRNDSSEIDRTKDSRSSDRRMTPMNSVVGGRRHRASELIALMMLRERKAKEKMRGWIDGQMSCHFNSNLNPTLVDKSNPNREETKETDRTNFQPTGRFDRHEPHLAVRSRISFERGIGISKSCQANGSVRIRNEGRIDRRDRQMQQNNWVWVVPSHRRHHHRSLVFRFPKQQEGGSRCWSVCFGGGKTTVVTAAAAIVVVVLW